MKKKYFSLNIRIDKELEELLRQMAKEKHCSMGYLVREMMRKSINSL